jgi:hypothetical protein
LEAKGASPNHAIDVAEIVVPMIWMTNN